MGTRRFLYNGQLGVVTDENGLYHMRARYYNTDIKRFISRDIVSGDITNSQSLNRYCYVQGNPLSYTDPFGLSPESSWNQTGHAILDVLGFVPVIGVFADIANGIWYLKEGKIFEAACCFVSAVPGAGDLLGKGLKAAGKLTKGLCTANKLSRAGDLLKLGAQVAGNAGSLALSGAIIWDNATNIGNYLVGNEYKYDVWDSVSAIGFALIGAVLGAKGLEDSGKAFKGLKNKPAGIGSPNKTSGKGTVQTISNKFPDDNQAGKGFNYTIENGRVHTENGVHDVDFVIDMEGKLQIGRGHSYLAGRGSVQAAGTMKINSKGYIRLITNESGHFQPTTIQAMNYPEIFRNAGLNIDNSWIRIGEFKTSMSNYVIDSNIFYNGPIKNMP